MIPYGCEEWALDKHLDIENDPIDYLSQTFLILVGRDDHGARSYERRSLFAFITDPTEMKVLIERFGDHILTYRNEFGGNVLHEIVTNPNPECYFMLAETLSDEVLSELANEEDRLKKKPLAYNYDLRIFQHLMNYTNFTPALLTECLQNSNEIAEHMLSILTAEGVIM